MEELRLTDVGTCGVSPLESALLKRLVYSWVEKAAAKSWLLINSCDEQQTNNGALTLAGDEGNGGEG